jgi:hypothetical protein
MHIPKSAGSSLYETFVTAFPTGAVAPVLHDRTIFGAFSAFDELTEPLSSLVVTTPARFDELGAQRYRVISGHLSLPTLRAVAPDSAVATVLREPRSRILSFYLFLRCQPGLSQLTHPYPMTADAARPLAEFLAEPRAACLIDNEIARFLLAGDPRLPPDDFMAAADADGVAADAIAQLDGLGCLEILELGDAAWGGLERFFGVPLAPGRVNVTGGLGYVEGSLPIPAPITEESLALLDARCSADRIVYEHVLAARCGDRARARRIADVAFARQLVTLGDVGGHSAARAIEQARRPADRRR